jgi:hypothetical protein
MVALATGKVREALTASEASVRLAIQSDTYQALSSPTVGLHFYISAPTTSKRSGIWHQSSSGIVKNMGFHIDWHWERLAGDGILARTGNVDDGLEELRSASRSSALCGPDSWFRRGSYAWLTLRIKGRFAEAKGSTRRSLRKLRSCSIRFNKHMTALLGLHHCTGSDLAKGSDRMDPSDFVFRVQSVTSLLT